MGGSAIAGAAFGGAGRLAAGFKGVGKEFSHFIPIRFGSAFKKNSLWNGNYVSSARHFRHDGYRYPVGYRDMGNRLQQGLRQFDRIPAAPAGVTAGGAWGTTNGSQANGGY